MNAIKTDRALVIAAAILIAAVAFWSAPSGRAQSTPSAIVGVWVLNSSLSDRAPAPAAGDDGAGRGDDRESGGDRGGRRGRGGFGGGFGGFGGSRPGADRGSRTAAMQRRQDAVRDLLSPPDRLTIVQTDSMVIITAGDGRTTRLAPDASKIKDESTGASRQTHWDGEKLVSEISGLGPGTITETYAEDGDPRRLTITVEMPAARDKKQTVTVRHVYDAQPD